MSKLIQDVRVYRGAAIKNRQLLDIYESVTFIEITK